MPIYPEDLRPKLIIIIIQAEILETKEHCAAEDLRLLLIDTPTLR